MFIINMLLKLINSNLIKKIKKLIINKVGIHYKTSLNKLKYYK